MYQVTIVPDQRIQLLNSILFDFELYLMVSIPVNERIANGRFSNKQQQQTSICVIAGGEQAYLTKMYCPLVGFLFVWTNTLILNPGGLAAISLYCAEYIVVNIQK